jgi:hypothetical protein
VKSTREEFTILRNFGGMVRGSMSGISFSSLLILAVAISAILLSPFVMAADKGCEALRKDLDLKREQLAEYLVTVEKFRERGETELESLLKHKINDLLEKINRAEEVTDCARVTAPAAPEGISPVKSDAGEYGTKSCAELRTMLVQLLRKTKSLKRREHSTFSELTSAEKSILQESEKELRTVTKILKSRCVRDAGSGPTRGVKKRKANP